MKYNILLYILTVPYVVIFRPTMAFGQLLTDNPCREVTKALNISCQSADSQFLVMSKSYEKYLLMPFCYQYRFRVVSHQLVLVSNVRLKSITVKMCTFFRVTISAFNSSQIFFTKYCVFCRPVAAKQCDMWFSKIDLETKFLQHH